MNGVGIMKPEYKLLNNQLPDLDPDFDPDKVEIIVLNVINVL